MAAADDAAAAPSRSTTVAAAAALSGSSACVGGGDGIRCSSRHDAQSTKSQPAVQRQPPLVLALQASQNAFCRRAAAPIPGPRVCGWLAHKQASVSPWRNRQVFSNLHLPMLRQNSHSGTPSLPRSTGAFSVGCCRAGDDSCCTGATTGSISSAVPWTSSPASPA